jgi:hypothetical protein
MQKKILFSYNHPLPALRFHDANDLKRLPLAAVAGGRSGLVGQDVLDLLHDLGSDLGKQCHGLAVVLDLGNLGGTKDDGGDVGVHHTPASMSVCE